MSISVSALPPKRTSRSTVAISRRKGHVRFTPKSGQVQCNCPCPLWVKSRNVQREKPCPLYPRDFRRRKATARSAISNGKTILPGTDGRSVIARRYFDIQCALLADQGGADQISEARLQLIRRFAAAAVLAEEMEGQLARGEKIDIAQHALLVSSLVRLANRIGIDRVPRSINSPTLGQLLREDQSLREREAT